MTDVAADDVRDPRALLPADVDEARRPLHEVPALSDEEVGRVSSANAKRTAAARRRRGKMLRELCWRPRLCEIHWDDGCTGVATDPHEPLLRSRGGSIDERTAVVLGCSYCHDRVHAFPEMATARGLMIPTGGAISGNAPEPVRTAVNSIERDVSAPEPF